MVETSDEGLKRVLLTLGGEAWVLDGEDHLLLRYFTEAYFLIYIYIMDIMSILFPLLYVMNYYIQLFVEFLFCI